MDDLSSSFRPAGRGRRSATSATTCKICRSQTIKVGTKRAALSLSPSEASGDGIMGDLPSSFRPVGRGRRSATSATNCKICRSQLSRWGQARCAVPVAERSVRRRNNGRFTKFVPSCRTGMPQRDIPHQLQNMPFTNYQGGDKARCAVTVAERSVRRRKQRVIYQVRSVLPDGNAAARHSPPSAKMDELNLNRLP